MSERMVKVDGIELWTESFGSAADPALLLIMGAGAQGVLWPEELCARLVAGGRHVLRYDHRDTGRSSCVDFEIDPYGLADLTRDAVGVLDAYGLDRAHVVGASMGGMIGQLLAIEHAGRVASLTSIMSTPNQTASAILEGDTSSSLPPPSPEFIARLTAVLVLPTETREQRIAKRLELFRVTAGSRIPFEEERMRALFEREHDRARDPAASDNHARAIVGSADRRPALAHVRLPVLVIHGTEDPICPYAHGVATAEAIPGARLLSIEGMGHELPAPLWPELADAILEHTGRAG